MNKNQIINLTIALFLTVSLTLNIYLFIALQRQERQQQNLVCVTSQKLFQDMSPQEFLDRYEQVVVPDANGNYTVSWGMNTTNS